RLTCLPLSRTPRTLTRERQHAGAPASEHVGSPALITLDTPDPSTLDRQAPSSISRLEIDAMPQRLARGGAPAVVDEDRREVFGSAQCGGVRRDEDVRRAPENVIGRQRRVLEHVEHGAGESPLL